MCRISCGMLRAHHCAREGSRGLSNQWAAIARHTDGTVSVQWNLMRDWESSGWACDHYLDGLGDAVVHHKSHVRLVDSCTHMRTWVARLPCELHVASLHALQPAERSTYSRALIQERQREECAQGGALTMVSEEKLQRARSHMPMAHSMELWMIVQKKRRACRERAHPCQRRWWPRQPAAPRCATGSAPGCAAWASCPHDSCKPQSRPHSACTRIPVTGHAVCSVSLVFFCS
jgi:hypothetical protein